LLLHACLVLGLLFDSEDEGDMFLQNFGLTLTELHDVISQKIDLCIQKLLSSSPQSSFNLSLETVENFVTDMVTIIT
jgi:hypothetical protein